MNPREDPIAATAAYVRTELGAEGSGHDWGHVARVWATARELAAAEAPVDLRVVELAALLHDVGDPKLHGGDTTVGPRKVGAWLDRLGLAPPTRAAITRILETMSFSKSFDGGAVVKTKELMIVQDADRLDALGAIGIARAFAYGGSKGRLIWDPDQPPRSYASAREYHAAGGSTINHFHEKLLLLKDRMNTAAARRMAEARHAFMERFLEQFHAEWDGRR